MAEPNDSRDTKSLPRMTLETCDASAWLRPKEDVHAGPVRKQTNNIPNSQCARGGLSVRDAFVNKHGESSVCARNMDAPKPKQCSSGKSWRQSAASRAATPAPMLWPQRRRRYPGNRCRVSATSGRSTISKASAAFKKPASPPPMDFNPPRPESKESEG